MGLIPMSERDLKRIEVLTEVVSGRRTGASAAAVLALSGRQTFRLLAKYQEQGGGGLIHKARGRPSNRRMKAGIRKYAVELVGTRYADFGPMLASEVLLEKHAIKVGRETLRRWMIADGLGGKYLDLYHFPDGRLEVRWKGRSLPYRVFRKDQRVSHTVIVENKRLGHALSIIKAQQDLKRIPRVMTNSEKDGYKKRPRKISGPPELAMKKLRIAGICHMAAGNAFLPSFLERFNERFSVSSARPEDLHRPLRVAPDRLNDILCHREQRYVCDQLALSYDRKRIILERNDLSESLGGRYVDLYHFQGKRLEVCWKGHSLPYRVFSKDQRVSHTAIVENKRVGHALSIIKAHQDIKRIQKVMTNSEKDRYKKRPRKVYGPTEIEIDSAFAKTAVEMTV
jgi:hypothetical protein